MECEIYDALLANYKLAVRLFTKAELSFRGAIRDDFRLALKELKRLKQACKDADNALMDHWRQDHDNYLGPKP
jgi:hypothetical protein